MSLELETITNYEKVSTMNANFEAIVEEFLNKLDRVSSEDGNAMEQDLDMNGYTILNAVIDDSTLQETFDSFLEQAESDIDDYVVDTAFPQIDAYSTEVVDTYVTDTVKPEIDTYVVDVSEATIDDYVENTSKPSLDTYVEDTLQPELEAFCTLAEQWASEDEDVLVDGTDYSAKHYAAKASASASSASTSESNAATSATNAATSEANTQALFDNFDSSVAESVGLAAIPYPDLHIPFNDGLRIESGYGTNDQIDVSAAQDGSVMVDLPSMSVDFTRSTGCYYPNKSGLISYADIDEMCIGKDGLLLDDSFSSQNPYSLSFSSWSNPNSASIITDGTLKPFNFQEDLCELITFDSSGDNRLVNSNVESFTGYATIIAIIKPESGDGCRLRVTSSEGSVNINFNFSTETAYETTTTGLMYSYSFEKISDGYYIIRAFLDTSTYSVLYLYPVSTGIGSAYVAYCDIYNGYADSLLSINTSETQGAITVSKSKAILPVLNNLNQGIDFTVEVDVKSIFLKEESAAPDVNSARGLVQLGDSLTLRRQSYNATFSNFLLCIIDQGGTGYNDYLSSDLPSTDHVKIVIVKEGLSASMYVNNVLLSYKESDGSGFAYDIGDYIRLGSTSDSSLTTGGSFKNFKIYHTALTAEQVAALGAAE